MGTRRVIHRSAVIFAVAFATIAAAKAPPEIGVKPVNIRAEGRFAVTPEGPLGMSMSDGFLSDAPVDSRWVSVKGADIEPKGTAFDLNIGSILLREPGDNPSTRRIVNEISSGQVVRPQVIYSVDNFSGSFNHVVRISVDGQTFCEIDSNPTSGGFRFATCGELTISSGQTVITAEVDATQRVVESNENNNFQSRTYDTRSSFSLDFVADQVFLTSDSAGNNVVDNPQPGQQLFPHFQFDVNASINYYWRAEMSLGDGTRLCGFVFFFPDPDGSSWDISCNQPITVPNGSFTLIGEVDYLDEQAESNERNNVASRTYGTTAPPAQQVIIDFEGLQNVEPVESYYAGGSGGLGSTGGTNFGVDFGPNALAIIDSDAGGSGNFGGEPSPDTVLFFQMGSAIMNVPAGFDTGFSFFYSAINAAGEVVVYDGVDATGNVLARVQLPITQQDSGDPTGDFSPFFPVGVSFAGVARSVDFSGVAERIGFDNITFGTATPGGNATIGINQVTPDACPDVQAIVSVVDASGNPITGLGNSNFDVIDNGLMVTSTVQTVTGTGSVAQIALVFDTSGSMSGQAISDARDASQAFVNSLNTTDEVALYSFASTVTQRVNFTTNKNTVNNAIAALSAGGGTAFYDAVIQASNALGARGGRKAVVAFTDGNDTSSSNSLTSAISAANAAGVPVFTVGFGQAETGVLSQISSSTGGLFFNGGLDTASLQQLLLRIGQILNNQYVVTWSPDLSQQGTHTAEIIVTTPLATSRDTVMYDASICPTANTPPAASFRADTTSGSLTVNFTDTSTDSDGSIVSRRWDFGDGTTSTQRNPSHTYATSGAYTVMLTVTDDGGATATAVATVNVEAEMLTAPVAVPTPANIGAEDRYGSAIAASGSTFAVGAPMDDLAGTDSGSVVTFSLINGQPVADPPLEIPAGFVTGGFGTSLSQKGNLLVVGAPGAVAAAKRKGGLNPLSAALYERAQQGFGFKAPIAANVEADDEFGASVAVDGRSVIVGAPGTNDDEGAAYVFRQEGGQFRQIAMLTPPAGAMRFGAAVAASNGKFAVGAPGGPIGNAVMGTVSLFDMLNNNLRDRGSVTGAGSQMGDAFGTAVALEGNTLVVGSPGNDADANNAGAAYLFDFLGNSVQERGRIASASPGNNRLFGSSVSVAGGNVVIGSPGQTRSGARPGGAFAYRIGATSAVASDNLAAKGVMAPVTFLRRLNPPEGQDGFGTAVAASGTQILIGAPETGPNSGAVSRSEGLRTSSRLLKPILAVDPSRGCPGFYIARVDGLNDTGRWSLEIALEPGVSPILQGGLNLGGGFGPITSPGFAAFSIANRSNENQRVTIDVDVVKAAGVQYRVDIVERTGGTSNVVFSTDSNQNSITVEQVLSPGFYSMRIYTFGAQAASERGIFTMALLTRFVDRPGGAFQGGVNLGGIIENDSTRDTNEGFAAICIDTEQEVRFTTFGNSAFGNQGIENLGIRVLDRNRDPVVADPGD